jgi:diguanylate cyclase (GGDEF)-like protein
MAPPGPPKEEGRGLMGEEPMPPSDPSRSAAPGIPLPVARAAHLVYTATPFPLCVVDAAGRLVAMNPAAERFWGVHAGDVLGSAAGDVLGIRAPEEGPGAGDPLRQALRGTGERVPCRISTRDGLTHQAALVGSPLQQGGYAVLSAVTPAEAPEWVLTDPVTGLPNRVAWQQEEAQWATRRGAVVLFDVDDLKDVNDHQGHRRGDLLLALVGEVLRDRTPAGGRALRWGGDEFLVLLPGDEPGAAAFCADVVATVADRGARTMGFPPRLSAGWARLDPGGLEAALQAADTALYERKGVLLRAASGSRLVLTREGQRLLRQPEDPPAPTAAYAARFTVDFDAYFREAIVRAGEQARRFVAFVDPQPGIAAVEVGAGSGRITFEGGLAARIGPTGQLLVTDPSAAQLSVAQERAASAGVPWVRFLQAPAEALPVASGCVDLVLGALFLHFTDPVRAIAEMARVLRPGGRLALSTSLPFPWPPLFEEALQPLYEQADRLQLPRRHFNVPEEEVLAALQRTGLHVERTGRDADRARFPHAALARDFFAQLQIVALMLRGAPGPVIDAVERQVLRRIEALWEMYPAAARDGAFEYLNVVARKD